MTRPCYKGVSRDMDVIARYVFLGSCAQRISHKNVSDFERLRSYERLGFRLQGKDCRKDMG
jgi:hypothetical protein